jgi:hypothetical protein
VVFLPRPDTIIVSDTFHHYVIDSVEFGLTLQARDTLVDLPPVFCSTGCRSTSTRRPPLPTSRPA